MIHVREDQMREGFIKYYLGGLPFDAVIHELTIADLNNAHDHPFTFTSFVMEGWYIERIYINNISSGWEYYDVKREAGTAHIVQSNCIHEIIKLSPKGCYTLIIPEKEKQDWRHWEFRSDGVYYQVHGQENWIKYGIH